MHVLLLVYFLASSGQMSIIPLSLMGYAFKMRGRVSDVPFEDIVLFLPAATGIAGVCLYLYGQESVLLSYAFGAAYGLLVSLVGRFWFEVPTKLFAFTPETAWRVHVPTMAFYAVLFRILRAMIRPLCHV